MTTLIVVLILLIMVWLQRFIYRRTWHVGLGFALDFSSDTASEGDTITLSEKLDNAKRLPLPWVDVKFQVSRMLVFENSPSVGDSSGRAELFSVGPGKRVTRTFNVYCSRRGYYTINGMSVTVSDILKSNSYSMLFSCEQNITVYPSSIPYDSFSPIYRMIMGTVRTRRFINPDPFEFRGIREYQPTDSLRAVNHKATAKTGELMVNIFTPTASQRVTIWLGTDPYSSHPLDELYEAAIKLAATLAEQLIGDGLTVELRSGARNILSPGQCIYVPGGAGPAHLPRLLEALALADLTAEPEPISEVMKNAPELDSVHILISAYDGEEVGLSCERFSVEGQDVFWILPRMYGAPKRVAESDVRFYWDV